MLEILASSPSPYIIVALSENPISDPRLQGSQDTDLTETFHGCPLPHGTVLEESFPSQDQEYQRQIYERLARLTQLEHLELGYEDWDFQDECKLTYTASNLERWDDEHYLYNCLEMSLRSGLELLETLEELRVLDIMRMATLISVEVDWMALGGTQV
ncbi:hypothetical protein BG015_002554 [Linnemannia schmuckeri]|uniref:Uncharacterized protein n=1 Tax=Linnemannia schmuckeri TaxID=64567 RepID=A0A9P5RRV3_9FUNG|nr:hypothetical protein BG015_002554 [Linnemannia schmuckeri]